jgi:hypothetical protein
MKGREKKEKENRDSALRRGNLLSVLKRACTHHTTPKGGSRAEGLSRKKENEGRKEIRKRMGNRARHSSRISVDWHA